MVVNLRFGSQNISFSPVFSATVRLIIYFFFTKFRTFTEILISYSWKYFPCSDEDVFSISLFVMFFSKPQKWFFETLKNVLKFWKSRKTLGPAIENIFKSNITILKIWVNSVQNSAGKIINRELGTRKNRRYTTPLADEFTYSTIK